MKLFIKNMVCPRCIKAVESILNNLNYTPISVQLGEVIIKEDSNVNFSELRNCLANEGFELLEDEKAQMVDKIKTEIISVIQKYKYEDLEKIVFSAHLSELLNKDYSYLSNLFSKTEGTTIEHYIIKQKIEKAKELLKYGELSLSEISYQLGYSSVAHLSAQFKNVTGLTASQFKKQVANTRQSLDKI